VQQQQPAPGQQPAQVQPGGAPPRGPQPGLPQNAQPKQFQQQPRTDDVGNVEQLRSQRRERTEAGGRIVIEEPGGRSIVRENGRTIVRHDESERFRRFGDGRVERRGSENYTVFRRPGGVEIVTVTDANGRLLRRVRRGPDRREIVLIDNAPRRGGAGIYLNLPAPIVNIPRERYIVDVDNASPQLIYETFEAPPVQRIERAYSLDEIRYNVAVRDRMRRVDINTINFETGSWEVSPDQAPALQAIAEALMRMVSRNPNEVFMIEGHTDAVGNDDDNLSLSDRRAAAVADILTNDYQVPPENLVTQGYGEQYLKVQTDGPSRENRRVTARRITPLLKGASR
jgi:outer membrane protein OmpA-like peptidoglycan-associated protein